MQPIHLAMIVALYLHDALPPGELPLLSLPLAFVVASVVMPKLLLWSIYAWACRTTLGHLGKPIGPRWLRRLDRLTHSTRFAALFFMLGDLALGALLLSRQTVGNLVLIDEALVLLPTLALLVAMWWSYYPIDRRLREAGLIGQVDRGGPIYAVWTRGQYLLTQWRLQMAMILVPLAAIYAWHEAVLWWPGWSSIAPGIAQWAQPVATTIGALAVFVFAPLMLRLIWHTTPLPDGEIRATLAAMCRTHRVGVRQLLVWHTHGGIINAAVMGLIKPLRYVLLTDALLDTLHRPQVEAVMAHELGHVKHRHMPWLAAMAITSLAAAELIATGMLMAAYALFVASPGDASWLDAQWRGSTIAWLAALLVIAGLIWFVLFGWVSRRVERQADAFAVQHLANHSQPDTATPRDDRITERDAEAMIVALSQVAMLNHVPITKQSWRHGSIRWRQDHLRSLVGRPIHDLPIDRTMKRIKISTLLLLAGIIAMLASGWI